MLLSHKAGFSKTMMMLAISLLAVGLNLALGDTSLADPSVSKKRIRLKQFATANNYIAELKLKQTGLLDVSQQKGFCNAVITSLQFSSAAILTCAVLNQSVIDSSKKKIFVQFQVSVTSSDAAEITGANQKIVDSFNAEFFVADLVNNLNRNNVPTKKFRLESYSSPVVPTAPVAPPPTRAPTQAPLTPAASIYISEMYWAQVGLMNQAQKNAFCLSMTLTLIIPGAVLSCNVLSQTGGSADGSANGIILVQYTLPVSSADPNVVATSSQTIVNKLNDPTEITKLVTSLNINGVPAYNIILKSFSTPATPAPTRAPTRVPTRAPTQAPLTSAASIYISEMYWAQVGLMNEAQKNAFCLSMTLTLTIPGATVLCNVLSQTGGSANGIILVQYTLPVSSADPNVVATSSQTIVSKLNDPTAVTTLVAYLNSSGVPATNIILKSFSTPATPAPTRAPTKPTGCNGLAKKKCNKQACCRFKSGVCKDSKCDPCRPLAKNECNQANCCKYKKNKNRCKFNENVAGCSLTK